MTCERLEDRRVLSGLLYASDFGYLGAFRLPNGSFGPSRFGFGGTALAFNENDPVDAVDDTLFMVGHDHHQLVAEVSIPTPVRSDNLADLSTAGVVQPFADVTDGLKWNLEGNVKIGGLLVNDGELIWSAFEYYDANVNAAFSHGTSPLDLSNPADAHGMYRVGNLNPGFTAGYMTHVPEEWQSEIGAPILTGQSSGMLAIVSRTSAGPSLFGFDPNEFGGGTVPATPLLYYVSPGDGSQELAGGMESQNPLYNFNSSIGGVVFPEGSRSVVFFGRHARGEVCYGTPQVCNDPVENGKGWHDVGGNYIYQAWAYDVLDLLAVKAGQKQPWQVEPYASWEINFPIDQADANILGVAYDPRTNRVFVSQGTADNANLSPRPLIHVYEIQNQAPQVSLLVDATAIPESDGVATVTAQLSSTTNVPVTVTVRFSGTAGADDFVTTGTELVIAPGESSASITVSTVPDDIDEPDETLTVNIVRATGGVNIGVRQKSIEIIDDDLPTPFSVTTFTPNASGFQVDLTNEIDVQQLNLYDTLYMDFGLPDALIAGAEVGPVSGSLISNAASSSVWFVKTGGPLEADTYSVTLRSAGDGFKDTGGMLLDGNGDGVGGDDYVTSFTVEAPVPDVRTVSIPDFVRGPGQSVNVPVRKETGIPITISEGEDVRIIDLRIAYDPGLLTLTGATAREGGTAVLSHIAPGLTSLVYFSAATLPAGESTFVNLHATIPTSNTDDIYGRLQRIDFYDVIVGDGGGGTFPVVADDAVHLATHFADVSGNGQINATDAAQLASYVAGLDTGFAASLTTDPFLLGDISNNGRVNAFDAASVPEFAVAVPTGAGVQRISLAAVAIRKPGLSLPDSPSQHGGVDIAYDLPTTTESREHWQPSDERTAAYLAERAIDIILVDDDPLLLNLGEAIDMIAVLRAR